MKRSGIVGLGIVAALAVACNGTPTAGRSEIRLVDFDGAVKVRHEGEWTPVEEATDLERGDQVSVGRDGGARVELPGGGSIELSEMARLSFQSLKEPRVLRGSVLAESGKGLNLAAQGFKVVAEDQATLRVDLLLGHRVGVYDGEVMVPGSGWGAPVGELQQLGLVGGTAPTGPTPLLIRATDAWDLRLLGDAIDVGAALGQKETGLRAQLQGKAAQLALNRVLGGHVSKPERAALLAQYAPEWLVVAAMVALEVGEQPTAPVLREILDLRSLAGWQIVAGLYDVASSVLQKIGVLAGQVLNEVARLALEQLTGSSRPSPRSGGGSSGGGSGGGGGGGGNGGRKKPPNPTPTPTPTPTPPPPCDLACTVNGVLGDTPVGS